MSFQISPGVSYQEIDLTTVVGTGISTSVGAFVGNFQWGPTSEITLVSNENDLVSIFGKPNDNTFKDFFVASSFLSYTSALQIIRVVDANTKNAVSGNTAVLIENDNDYTTKNLFHSGKWIARYPGTLGNSLAVIACDSTVVTTTSVTVGSTVIGKWSDFISAKPSTSNQALAIGGSLDEMHVLVIDSGGLISGTKGTVLERFMHVSKAPGAKTEDGTNNYYKDRINQTSHYVRVGDQYILNSLSTGKISDTWVAAGTDIAVLSKGVSPDADGDDYINGYNILGNGEAVDISLIISGAATITTAQKCIDIASNRRDCVAFISPLWTDVQPGIPASTIVTNVVATEQALNRISSYFVVDSGWKYIYDAYNDVYRWIPLNGDIAGLCARTDQTRDPWWSPAGFNRGNIQNIVRLAWNPNQAQRDLLYQNSVNPVVSFPGEGTILYGDKTGLAKPSAFDRINVRRLFIILEKSIAKSAKYSLFEFNDEFTRAQFRAMVEPFLRDVKGRRGIYDFLVVCDETNNTPQVIDSNTFIGDIYIKPARSINFIQLNFIATRTGTLFSEIVGKW